MQPRPISRSAETPRGPLFWAATITLACAQLVAFWMLCSQQMANAQARHAAVQVERMALDDCLRSRPGAALGSCAGRAATPASQPDNMVAVMGVPRSTGQPLMGRVVPVNYR